MLHGEGKDNWLLIKHFLVMQKNLLGTGNSGFAEGNPILVLFEPGAIKLLELEREPDGSISHGETLLCLASISSHLTCKKEPRLIATIKSHNFCRNISY
jgi:hypothetical protein